MLIVKFVGIDVESFVEKYSNYAIYLDAKNYDKQNKDWVIDFIENLKEAQTQNDVVFIPYISEVVMCLDALKMEYLLLLPHNEDTKIIDANEFEYYNLLDKSDEIDTIFLDVGESVESALKSSCDWITITQDESPAPTVDLIDVEPIESPTINKNKLTLQELIEQDIDITEADVRELKSTTNKFKVAMLLQAKSRLNTVLKLCNVLDKLYDELVTRIDESIKTTDTASLMYTTDYIAKALSETNQFIMSLITNEKIQNFFIIDNSSVINISDDRVDINKRERIRKAAEIVIDNIDYFTSGDFSQIKNPNTTIEAQVIDVGGDNSANTTT